MEKQRDQLVNDGVQSIRRLSFIEPYGIKEVEDEAGSTSASDDHNNRQSLSNSDLADADLIDIDVTTRTNNFTSRHDISLLGFDNSHPSNIDNDKKDDPFNDSSKSPPNFAGGGQRRRGSKQRRMRQRLGLGAHKQSFGDGRRSSSEGQILHTNVSCCFNYFVYFFT